MRKRKIRKIGNSFYVKLEQVDMRDWELSNGDPVEVNKINSVEPYIPKDLNS